MLTKFYARVKRAEREAQQNKLNIVELALALHDQGDKYTGIADHLGIVPQTLHSWILQAKAGRLGSNDEPSFEELRIEYMERMAGAKSIFD